jgi:hypothetical protein
MSVSILRSLVFWFGLTVLLFLSWAWWDSLRFETTAAWDGTKLIRLRDLDSQVEIYIAEGAGSGRSWFRNQADPQRDPGPLLPRPSFERLSIDDQPVYLMSAPHWLLMALASSVWLPLAAWHARSIARARDAQAV